MNAVTIRLLPEQDLKQALQAYCVEHQIDAACVISCVGSLERATLRMAGGTDTKIFWGAREIVSLVGTLSQYGCHLHVSLSDNEGQVIGGHLMDGSPINTTAEVVLGLIDGVIFTREADQRTGYKELVMTPKNLPTR